jgi:hypothetical protein
MHASGQHLNKHTAGCKQQITFEMDSASGPEPSMVSGAIRVVWFIESRANTTNNQFLCVQLDSGSNPRHGMETDFLSTHLDHTF